MLKSLRWRLQLWHAVILCGVVTLFGAALYRQLHHSTLGEIDAQLLSGARVLEGALRALPRASLPGALANLPRELPAAAGWRPGPPPREPGRRLELPLPNEPPRPRLDPHPRSLSYAIFSRDGRLLRSSAGEVHSPWQIPRRPLEYRNADDRREIWLRGPHDTVIVVGRDVRGVWGRLTQSLVHLLVIGGAVLGLGLVGGWWLAGNAIQPIQSISSTAEKISASNLSQRIDTASMDEELRSLGNTLNSMLARLESSFNQQSQFTADASHELRTPISILKSHCELALRRPRSAEEYQRTLQTCHKAAERMQILVDGLLTLARADAGRLELKLEQIDLHELAADAVAMFAPYAKERRIQLALQGASAPCQGDAPRIIQVITNLLDNAILYSQSGGQVTLRTALDGDFALLQVQDTGPGIPPESQAHLFDRFYRVDPSRSRSVEHTQTGSGLGLAICKSIADAHGGRLTVNSKLGQGSLFELSLSRHAADSAGF